MQGQRLDKWIWCARLAKSRSIAADLIVAGKVRINGERARKSSRRVKPGDVLTGITFGRLWVVRVVAEAERRLPPSAVSELYQDLTPACGTAALSPQGAE
ncbi:RNA-binding S4 domain-containing protein [Methyloligella sp. 2.7D]|uniref:RNA-binding S4 domain-containing protein n=1 Tax=unclassified Methyloligella TaxID=2625955 RepID=UPI00157BDE85|nr:RNA-binding S4 domain-containing protein [Methyloligella sp. GL2]QKP76571.1 RNA-binding S4 domain-containing protein [Methyloligella sp. GL2]